MQTDTNASRPDSQQYSAYKCIKITSPASFVKVTYEIRQSHALQLCVASGAVSMPQQSFNSSQNLTLLFLDFLYLGFPHAFPLNL